VIIVLLLGFDPFLQALIYYVGQLDDDPTSNAITRIARADNLRIGTLSSNSMELVTIKTSSSNATFNTATAFPDFGLSAAVNYGFSQSSNITQQNASHDCPSANCTWPIYTSLAVCSACADITNHITRSTGVGDGNEALLSDGNSPTSQGNYTRFDIPFASNLHIMGYDGFCGHPCMDTELMTAKPTADPRQTLTFQNLSTMLLSVGIMQADSSFAENKTRWKDTPIKATECALYLCAKAYQSSVQNNILSETDLGSWANKELNSWRPVADQHIVPGTDKGSVAEVLDPFNGSLYWGDHEDLSISMTDLQIVIPANATIPAPLGGVGSSNLTRSFNVSQASISSTIQFLLSMWPTYNSTGSSSLGRLPYNASAENPSFSQYNIYFRSGNMPVFSAPIMQALYQVSNPEGQFANVAKSISNYIRGLGDNPQAGKSQVWVIHVRVRWGFVALPVLVLLVGCVFVLLSIVETRRLRLPAWKENAMPILTYGLDGSTRASLRDVGVEGAHRAWKTVVRLVDEKDGLELKS
jgi:hypothetical protein